MVAELVAGLGDANLWYGKGVSFAPEAEGCHAGDISLKRKYNKIINRTEIIPGLCFVYLPVGAFAIGIGDFRQRCIQPVVGTTGANFGFAYGGEVLVHSSFVLHTHFFLETTDFLEVVI